MKHAHFHEHTSLVLRSGSGVRPLVLRNGWTGTENCGVNDGLTVTVEFNKAVTFTEGTIPNGVQITSSGGGVFNFTTAVGSGTNTVAYSGGTGWDVVPTPADVIQWAYTGGDYRDDSFAPDPAVPLAAQNTVLNNCSSADRIVVTTTGEISTPDDPAKPPTNEQLTIRFTGLKVDDWPANNNNRLIDKRTNIGYTKTEIDVFMLQEKIGAYNGDGSSIFPIDMAAYNGKTINLELRFAPDQFQMLVNGAMIHHDPDAGRRIGYAVSPLRIFGNQGGSDVTFNNASFKRLEYISEGVTLFDCNAKDWVSGGTITSSTTGEVWTLQGDAAIKLVGE